MLLAILLTVGFCLGILIVATAIASSRIERAYPRKGRMIDVEGGRLHVAELGPDGADPARAVVLLHGASGNLEDMRLALAEKLAARHRVILIDRPGHGWSERFGGDADASPGQQALLVARVLERLGATKPIMVGHSWSGALVTAYALAFPDRISGLILLAAVTHPWPGSIAWYYRLSTTPLFGPLFAHTVTLPIGGMALKHVVTAVFAPHEPPLDYVRRAAIPLVLRPRQFLANARDVAGLKEFVVAQAPRYSEIKTPTVIITYDRDTTVSSRIHSRAIAAMLPNNALIVLQGPGHMPHHSASDAVINAIEKLVTAASEDAGATLER
jgi:pimeloyl-ACP methyl ester carboxylesterase